HQHAQVEYFNIQNLTHLRLPDEPDRVLQVDKEAGVTLSKVLTTHYQTTPKPQSYAEASARQ
ncbi:hypothetical protein pipiens_016468, partial [Culex pipiens pipiens]